MRLAFLLAVAAGPALPDAYDETGGWSALVCPPGIETMQLDALDLSPVGTLLPPGLDPDEWIAVGAVASAEYLPRPGGASPAGPGTPKPVPTPWPGMLIGFALMLLAPLVYYRYGPKSGR